MDDCIFCRIIAGAAPAWRVYETETTLAFFDINPVTPYHTLVVPKAHYTNVFDAPAGEWGDVMATAKHVVDHYAERLGLANVQVVSNAGRAGQQDVFHLHVHVIPRHPGDGQNVRWSSHPELREAFGDMLERVL